MAGFCRKLFHKKLKFKDAAGLALSDEAYNRLKEEQTAIAMRLLARDYASLLPDEKAFLQAFSQSGYVR
ncbi:MAG: hypothetical protein K2M92_03445 [Bacteroidales bacterium]|nr:hypothetical protein [Bacteroidales bacterium]